MQPPETRPRLHTWQRFGLGIPYAWLLIFFLAPFLIVLKISIADPVVAQPPFTPLLDATRPPGEALYATLENFRFVLGDRLYVLTYLNSLELAAVATLLCLLIGYPMAYGIARSNDATRSVLLLLVILPFWTSFLLRVYAWMGILNSRGVLNSVLLWAGIVDRPLEILYTQTAVFIGMVYSYLPFMILPLYANLVRLDESLLEAAADLGGRPSRVFRDVTLPLSLPGVIAGCLLVFIPALGLTTYNSVWKAHRAWERGTLENMSVWEPVIWPFLTGIALGVTALLLQVILESIRHAIGLFDPDLVEPPSASDPRSTS